MSDEPKSNVIPFKPRQSEEDKREIAEEEEILRQIEAMFGLGRPIL